MQTSTKISFDNLEIAFSSKSDQQLKKQYLIFSAMNNNALVSFGTKFSNLALKLGLPVKGIIKSTVFSHFCGGENIQECEPTIKSLSEFGIGTILDYSVEGGEKEDGFDHTRDEIIATIHKASNNKAIPFSVFKITGLASTPLLAKVQAGKQLNQVETEAFERVKARVNAICKSAFDHGVRIFIDAEETWIQDTIDQMVYEMMFLYNKETAIVYNTYQMYRADMLGNLSEALQNAREKRYYLGAKLVRGAYMEKERARAKEMGYPSPIQPNKAASDRDFDAALKLAMDNKDVFYICCGSHNERSTIYLAELMNEHGLKNDDARFFFAQLYGMSDNISYNLANAGYNVAKYVPYGPIKSVMPYLGRRAAENTSIAGQSSREFELVKREMARRKANK